MNMPGLCLILILLLLGQTNLGHAQPLEDISLEGGDTTIDDDSSKSYTHPLANLTNGDDYQKHDLGKEGFHKNFARSPINGKIVAGPKFNHISCVGCHINNGRGETKFAQSKSQSVIKISAKVGQPTLPGGPIPVPNFGLQLRDHSLGGVTPDSKISVTWEPIQGSYNDGTPYELRRPIVKIKQNKLPSGTMISLRRAPPVFGVGLLDAIGSQTILSLADPNDSNQDGISGRANMVWDIISKKQKIGRFGWKAGSPTAKQQIATAYAIDMGITNPIISLGDKIPEINKRILNRTVFYTQTLGVPRARDQSLAAVKKGKELFVTLNCSGCHLMTVTTGNHSIEELSNQTIHPFTDLLLHDMGEALSDDRPEFMASGAEWRTPPLWGIGLTGAALNNKPENYLHDGRARSLAEAILWHGGEAETSKQGFLNSSAADRDALIKFLRSL